MTDVMNHPEKPIVRPPTYLDHASLTPPVTEALDAMRDAALRSWGQPGSLHSIGSRALYVLDTARRQVADYLGVTWQEVVFTSSGRAGLGLAMERALARVAPGAVMVASRQDHPAMQALVEARAREGFDVRWLAMPGGAPSDDDVRAIEGAAVIAMSACNHELGTSVLEVLGRARPDAMRVIDAVQLAPWASLAPLNDERTFYVVSGAKLGAPMGIGAVRVPSPEFYEARKAGSSLESDSAPWLMAVGLGAACAAREARRGEHLASARARAEELLAGLRAIAPGMLVNGAAEARLGPLLNVSFAGQYGKSMVAALSLEGVCISHTAACQARRAEASPVVRAAYPEVPERAVGATRWSVSERVTSDEVRVAVEATARVLSPRRSGA